MTLLNFYKFISFYEIYNKCYNTNKPYKSHLFLQNKNPLIKVVDSIKANTIFVLKFPITFIDFNIKYSNKSAQITTNNFILTRILKLQKVFKLPSVLFNTMIINVRIANKI